jgi:hypothetical protein
MVAIGKTDVVAISDIASHRTQFKLQDGVFSELRTLRPIGRIVPRAHFVHHPLHQPALAHLHRKAHEDLLGRTLAMRQAIIQQLHRRGIADFNEHWPPSAAQFHIAIRNRAQSEKAFPLTEKLDGKPSVEAQARWQGVH